MNRAPDSKIQGTFNVIAPNKLVGWVWDANSPSDRLSVDVYVNDTLVISLKANEKREDLKKAGIGDGEHAFSADLSGFLHQGENKLILRVCSGIEISGHTSTVTISETSNYPLFNLFANDGLVIRETYHGKMFLNTADEGVDQTLLEQGEWGIEEVELYNSLLGPGDSAIDVGAHIGSASLSLSDIVGASGQVHSFEPQRFNFLRLCANILLNAKSNITPNNSAVSHSENDKVFLPIVDYCARHASGSIAVDVKENPGSYSVNSVQLSDYCNEHKVLPKIIKIDVEGHELQVIEGAREVINRCKPSIYFECHDQSQLIQIKEYIKQIDSDYVFYWHAARIFKEKNFNHSVSPRYLSGAFSLNVLATKQVIKLEHPGLVPFEGDSEFWPTHRFPKYFRKKLSDKFG